MKGFLKVTYTALLAVVLCLQLNVAHAIDPTKHPEVSQSIRNQIALDKLQQESRAVAIYVKGLCCPSCSIGVRLKIAKLDFVDQSRFTKGVDLDPKHQIATVAIKEGHIADARELTKAVENSGYDAIHLYTLKEESLHTQQLSPEE